MDYDRFARTSLLNLNDDFILEDISDQNDYGANLIRPTEYEYADISVDSDGDGDDDDGTPDNDYGDMGCFMRRPLRKLGYTPEWQAQRSGEEEEEDDRMEEDAPDAVLSDSELQRVRRLQRLQAEQQQQVHEAQKLRGKKRKPETSIEDSYNLILPLGSTATATAHGQPQPQSPSLHVPLAELISPKRRVVFVGDPRRVSLSPKTKLHGLKVGASPRSPSCAAAFVAQSPKVYGRGRGRRMDEVRAGEGGVDMMDVD